MRLGLLPDERFDRLIADYPLLGSTSSPAATAPYDSCGDGDCRYGVTGRPAFKYEQARGRAVQADRRRPSCSASAGDRQRHWRTESGMPSKVTWRGEASRRPTQC